ncbi:MAG: substrate-binding domain-containing protein [Victivallales bacterium]|jgi:DNA-binding LacI/PurR family transcriptional regulator
MKSMFGLKKNDALYLQIASFYEQEIAENRLKPMDRLPSTTELAKQLKVNPDTVQQGLKLLMTRGLLERVPGRGTFIRKGINIKTIGVVFCKELLSDRDFSFYGVFLEKLISMLEKNGWTCRIFLTSRDNGYDTAFYQMKQAIENGEIRAMVEFCSNPFIRKWFKTECPLPSSQAELDIDFQDFTYTGLDYLIARGCEKIVLLGQSMEFLENMFPDAKTNFCKTRRIDPRRICVQHCGAHYTEGYKAVAQLFEKKDAFDGLLSVNDVIFQGALYALLEHGIKIPEQVKLLTYANKGLEIFCHLPLTKLQFDPAVAVDEVFHELMDKIAGRKHQPMRIKPELIVGKSCGE